MFLQQLHFSRHTGETFPASIPPAHGFIFMQGEKTGWLLSGGGPSKVVTYLNHLTSSLP